MAEEGSTEAAVFTEVEVEDSSRSSPSGAPFDNFAGQVAAVLLRPREFSIRGAAEDFIQTEVNRP